MSSREPRDAVSLARANASGLFYSAMFFSVFTNVLMLTGPLFMLQIYDRVLSSRSEETLVALAVLVTGLYFFLWLLEFARGRVMARVGSRIQHEFSGRVFSAALERSALHKGAQSRGQLQDLDVVRTFFGSAVMLSLFDAPWTPLFLVAIFIFHPMLGWLAVFGGAILIFATVINQMITRKANHRANGVALQAAQFARRVEAGSDTIWAQGMLQSVSERWAALQEKSMDQAEQAGDFTGTVSSFTRAFRLFLQSAMLAGGAWLVLQGNLTAGAMIAVSILLGRALVPLEAIVSHWPTLQRCWASWQDLNTLLRDFPERSLPAKLPEPVAQLDVSNASLRSPHGDTLLLDNVSLKLSPGEAIGVIGRSGSGKSSLGRVLVGLAEVSTGEVRLGGATLAQYGPERLGALIGYLPQEIQLFDGTVAQNIAQMAPQPDQTKVVTAARKAGVHDVILRLPKGYNTQLGGTETRLSGGQKQRLCLARALYNDPLILILDEPNSSLDAEGSEALNTVVCDLKDENRSVVIMTHRPTAISACDRLLVLEQGSVAGYGPRDDIIRSMMKNAGDVQRLVQRAGQ